MAGVCVDVMWQTGSKRWERLGAHFLRQPALGEMNHSAKPDLPLQTAFTHLRGWTYCLSAFC